MHLGMRESLLPLAIVLAVGASCSGEELADPGDGGAWTGVECDPSLCGEAEAQIYLGTFARVEEGTYRRVPVEDGMFVDVEAGQQGAQHFWVDFTATGVNEGCFVPVTYTLSTMDGEVVDQQSANGDYDPYERPEDLPALPESEAPFQVGGPHPFFIANSYIEDAHRVEHHFQVETEDGCGHSLVAEAVVVPFDERVERGELGDEEGL